MKLFLLVLFAVLNICDGWTTWQVFRFGGRERNDFIAWCIDHIGLYWALLLFKCGLVAFIWWLSPAWYYLLLIDIVYAWQVGQNYLQLQKHKQK